MYQNGEEFVFEGYDARNEFCTFLFTPEHKAFTALAQNMKGFDGQFILHSAGNKGQKP